MVLFGLGVAVVFIIALRLWYLQIIRGDEFRVQSENNRIRTVFVPPPRGLILDRNGKVIVKNRPSFNIEFVVEDSPQPVATINILSSILDVPVSDLQARMKDQRKRRRFEPKILLKDVSRDQLAKVAANRYRLPGVIINVVPARDYVYGETFAHVAGYIREITSAQLERSEYSKYVQGDLVGQYGLERKWEQYLQGKRGMQAVIVDATGTRIGEASFEPEAAGQNLFLTLDLEMQLAAEEGLKGKKGAVVAMDAKTGEILAMVSHPAFDPNMFTRELLPNEWKDLTMGADKKLNNRALQGTFPPGSVFKVFMAAAGLAEDLVTPANRVSCPGFFPFAGRNYRCHKKTGHGSVDLFQAVVMSCDVYFYSLGNRLGIDRIHKYASLFGLGEKSGIELGDEARGLVPSTAWKKAYFKDPGNQKWYPGETLSVSIGQGATNVTPLQISRGLAALVNGGHLYKPYLIRKIESTDGSFLDDNFHPEETNKIDLDPKKLNIVKDAMVGVVHDGHGTGKRASLEKEFGIKAGGKTGTAQVAALEFHKAGSHLDDHAWFAGYAPADDPQVVVTVLVENGGHGGVASAPIAKQVMEAYFDKKLPRLQPKEDPKEAGAKKTAATPIPEEHDSIAD